MAKFSAKIDEFSEEQTNKLNQLYEQMRHDGHDPNSPMREIFARLGDRWSMLLLQILRSGAMRSASLRRVTSRFSFEGEISQRMFTLRIRELEECGLVSRQIINTIPIGVDYKLTPKGEELLIEVEHVMQFIRLNYIK